MPIFFFAFLALFASAQDNPLRREWSSAPVRILHGLGSSCRETSPELRGVCLETGGGVLSASRSITQQASVACTALANEAGSLSRGFHILALAQGGLIARVLLHRCLQINRLIRKIVFVGTPHLGTEVFPAFSVAFGPGPARSASRLVSGFSRASNSAASHYFTGRGEPAYLRELNSQAYDPLYARLEGLVNILSVAESVVVPPSSVTFGAVANSATKAIVPAENLPFYVEHSKGIGALYRNGKMVNCFSNTPHARLTIQEANAVYSAFFGPPGDSPTSSIRKFVYAFPAKCTGVFVQ